MEVTTDGSGKGLASDDERRTRSTRRRLVVGGVGLCLVAAAVLGFGVVHLFDTGLDASPEVVLPFVGLEATDGLTVVSTGHDGWLDEQAEVVLQGSPADVDRALARARLSAAFEPGVDVQVRTHPAVSSLTDPRSARDRITSATGAPMYRVVVRGTSAADPGLDVLVVFAATV